MSHRPRRRGGMGAWAALLLVPLLVSAQPGRASARPGPPAPSPSSPQLLSWLSSAVQLESELGAMAHARGGTASVRRYGQLLTGDARLEAKQLRDVAAHRGIPLREPESLPPSLREQLSTLQGPAFDEAFLAVARNVDGRALSLLVQLAPTAQDGAARGTLRHLEPIFDQHLRLAVSLQRKAR